MIAQNRRKIVYEKMFRRPLLMAQNRQKIEIYEKIFRRPMPILIAKIKRNIYMSR